MTDRGQSTPRRIGPLTGYPVWLLPAAVFVLALGLRLYCIDCKALWYDETISVETAERGWEGIFSYRFGWVGNQTPLHYLLVWLTAQFADPVETALWLRLPSVLAGAATSLVVYKLGSRLFSRVHGLAAALLVAFSPQLIHYSQELRPYAMLTFLTVLSVWCLTEAALGGRGVWWVWFTLASVVNMLNSNIALTMVMPALGLTMLWVGWKVWQGRTQEKHAEGSNAPVSSQPPARNHALVYWLLSLTAISVVGSLMLVEVVSVPRQLMQTDQLSIGDVFSLLVVLTRWFTELSIAGQIERILQVVLLVLAAGALLLMFREGGKARFAAFPLFVFIVVPWLTLAYLLTRLYISPRYALASAPFYLILITYALVHPFQLLNSRSGTGSEEGASAVANFDIRNPRFVLSALPLLIVLAAFGLGALNTVRTIAPSPPPVFSDWRDFKEYIRAEARPNDFVVFVDNDGLDFATAMFYWRGSPPVPAYDVLDPRLATQRVEGDVLWVLAAPQPGTIHGVKVERESVGGGNIVDSLERMSLRLISRNAEHRAYLTLRGHVEQLRGRFAEAALVYRSASEGRYRVLGSEFLRTANGFLERGKTTEAWREAAMSKFMWPDNPEVHLWMARQLASEGKEVEARNSEQMALELRNVSMGVTR